MDGMKDDATYVRELNNLLQSFKREKLSFTHSYYDEDDDMQETYYEFLQKVAEAYNNWARENGFENDGEIRVEDSYNDYLEDGEFGSELTTDYESGIPWCFIKAFNNNVSFDKMQRSLEKTNSQPKKQEIKTSPTYTKNAREWNPSDKKRKQIDQAWRQEGNRLHTSPRAVNKDLENMWDKY